MRAKPVVGIARRRRVPIAPQPDVRRESGQFRPCRRIDEITGARYREVEPKSLALRDSPRLFAYGIPLRSGMQMKICETRNAFSMPL